MEPISNADRFVAMLRLRLAERALSKSANAKRAADAGKADETSGQSVAALAAQAGADDRHLRRTIVEQLLSDRLGSKLTNEPRFQQIVEDVTEIIADDAQLGSMLTDIVAGIRA